MTQNLTSEQPITEVVWKEKYRFVGEASKEDSFKRVVEGVYKNDEQKLAEAPRALEAMIRRHWVPAGRIQAGAGTGKRVTWINCFVSPTIEDSMKSSGVVNANGIMDSLKVAALTQQMGGGIGMDFSTLRPRGAIVRKVGSVSSGPLCFMDMWHAMCGTIMSSGSRRGAMMGTMRIDHPDIIEFIEAKHVPGRLTNFNVSVMATYAFMEALENNADWDLGFNVPRADGNHVEVLGKPGSQDEAWYVYQRLPARELWDLILKSTYNYAEPGIIFIDRVNERNNLKYCERIATTNPCGEQPLPPNGDCNLGAINLAAMVQDPFGVSPQLDWEGLDETVRVGVRFLDNVLDTTLYPTVEQEVEALAKRRIGLGITGLGNMLQQMKVRYGSEEAKNLTEDVMKEISHIAYRASVDLAEERGAFSLFEADKFLRSSFVQALPADIKEGIREVGIRNGVLLTIAPTGTTSIYIGNVSSGCEPTYAWSYTRKMRMEDDSFQDFDVEDYGYLMYCRMFGKSNGQDLPDYMVTATELTVLEHLGMQGALQKHVDASISKTINCPEEMDFEEFKQVYSHAWDLGLKGCTTYRPSGVRGAVLSVKSEEPRAVGPVPDRPAELEGSTYKVKWAPIGSAFYVTINDRINRDGERIPFEIFVNTMSVVHSEWITALTRTISAVFRRGGDITFLPTELEQIHSSDGGQWIEPNVWVPSLVAVIGRTINKHFVKIGLIQPAVPKIQPEPAEIVTEIAGERCPRCENPKSLIRAEGCARCLSCGYSNCG